MTFSFLPHQEACMTRQFVPSAPTPASSTTRCTTFCTLKTALKLHSITPQHSSVCFWSWVCHYAGITIACIPQEDGTVWGENMTFELLSPNGQLPLPCQLYCKSTKHPDTHQWKSMWISGVKSGIMLDHKLFLDEDQRLYATDCYLVPSNIHKHCSLSV